MTLGEEQKRRTPAGDGEPRRAPSGGEYAGAGMQFAVTMVVFLLVGMWLDRRLGTGPWLAIVLMFLGAGAAFYSMYRKLMGAQKRAQDEKTRKPS